jgi:hypothetical protein
MGGKAFGQLLLFIALVLPGGLALFRGYANTHDLKPPSDQIPSLIAELRAAKPDYIVIGDSMLTTRMDAAEISKRSGRRFFFYAQGGASSAAWYLYVKNVIVASGVRPRAVIFLFRNQYLTWPRFRVNGIYKDNLSVVSTGFDPVVARLLRPDPPARWDLVGWAKRWLTGPAGLFHSENASGEFHRNLENVALDLTSFGQRKEDRRQAMTARFSLASLRADLAAELPSEGAVNDNSQDARPRIFDPSPAKSFLPHLVELGDRSGIPLVFFRVKCRPVNGTKTPQSQELVTYIQGLQAWMKEHGCVFYDETPDETIALDRYQDGDHLSTAAKPWWTDYFWQRMEPVLP